MFQLNAEDRIRSWRDFRSKLCTLSLEESIVQTAQLWRHAPFTPYQLDPNDTIDWPDPWTMISKNIYCDVAKCLGIVYTLLLTDHRTALDIEIHQYKDEATGYEYNLAWFNQGKYIANLIDGELVNNKHIDKTLTLLRRYTAKELKLENY